MSAKIITFPGAQHAVESVNTEPVGEIAQEPVQEMPVETPAKPVAPAVYVRVRADVFMDMANALQAYSAQLFDHGRRAGAVLSRLYEKEPA